MTRRGGALWVGVVALVAACSVLLLSRRIAPEHHLAPGRLPPVVRSLLAGKMARHGQSMEALVWHVLLLEYDESATAARDIADEAPLARPLRGDATEINAQIPPRFFDLQDDSRIQVRAVGEAARRRDAAALGATYGDLARTCVACHQLYLDPR